MKYNKQALVEDLLLQDVFAAASKKQVTEFVEDFFELIATKIESGEGLSIPSFGKFTKYERQNGQFKPKFEPFTALKDRISA